MKTSIDRYPRYLTPETSPFDPVELARLTERIVIRNNSRKYTAFYATGVYGGIATGYTVGCCLRCIFCWVDWSRDFPEKLGNFYTPEDVFEKLKNTAYKFGVRKLRISGAEPTLGKKHLITLLELVEDSEFPLFILETNGILFGIDRDYVSKISRFEKVHVRISLKAGNPDGFEKRTGACKESFDIPFKAIENLLDYGVSFHIASMSADRRFMSKSERCELIERLASIDLNLVRNLEEEVVDPYDTTLKRLDLAGWYVVFK